MARMLFLQGAGRSRLDTYQTVLYVPIMIRNAAATRTRILDSAEQLFLSGGYAGTSLDAILSQTGLTKGAFFHHFDSKHELAHAVIARYAEADIQLLQDYMARAERLSRDPLQQVLILVGLYEEMMDGLTEPFPGCLFASYCYQAGMFDDSVLSIFRRTILDWREVLGKKLEAAVELHPPRMPVDVDEVADAVTVVIEGAFILSKSLNDPKLIARQIRHYRNYLELLFGAV